MNAIDAIRIINELEQPTPPRTSMVSEIVFWMKQIRGDDPDLLQLLLVALPKIEQLVPNEIARHKRWYLARKAWSESGANFNAEFHAIQALCKLSTTISKADDKERKQILHAKVDNPIVVSAQKIREAVSRISKSNNIYHRILLIQLATGVRSGEVMNKNSSKQATFKAIPNDPLHIEIFSKHKQKHFKQLRFMEEVERNQTPTMMRPILFGDSSWLEAHIAWVRIQAFPTTVECNFTRALNREFHTIFSETVVEGSDVQHLTVHCLRKIYCQMAWREFAPQVAENIYIRKLLGHTSDSDQVAYQTIRVVE